MHHYGSREDQMSDRQDEVLQQKKYEHLIQQG
jgi:hypothetical protein